MTVILWARHTEHVLGPRTVAGRRPGVSLSEEGRRDARDLAQRLSAHLIRVIYRSPMQRTGETAEPVAERLGLEPRELSEINEVEFGAWTGLTLDQLEPLPEWQHWNRVRSQARPPGGEMMVEVQARIASATERLCREHAGEMIALFSHGDVIRAAMAMALGVPIDQFLRIEIGLGSVSAVRMGEGEPRVLCVNAMSRESMLGR